MADARVQELVLAVDDNHEALYALEQTLLHQGYRVETANDGAEALEKAAKFRPAVIFMDVVMPRLDGYLAVRKLKADPELCFTPVILLTAKDSLEDIVRGLDAGADDYIIKPFEPGELLARLRASLRLRSLYSDLRQSENRNNVLLEQLSYQYNFANIVGESAAMKRVFALLEKVIDVDSPVLITGPSGTGKELIARAIHFNSRRRSQPFIAVNCAAISENLLESELFGHLKGAFTGALRDKIGLFEAAHGGTLFLDEIGEMSGTLQPKLLRVLQEGAFLPVGSTEERKADVRILAATNRELLKMVEAGRFRDDLYYRLNVINIELPPLKDRKEDILPIAQRLLAKFAEERGQAVKQLSVEAAEMLKNYSWRGNVRELQNEIDRILILGQDSVLLGADVLSTRIVDEYYSRGKAEVEGNEGSVLRRAVDEVERKMIQEALVRFSGNKTAAAKELGMSRSSLISKVQQYGLERAKSPK